MIERGTGASLLRLVMHLWHTCDAYFVAYRTLFVTKCITASQIYKCMACVKTFFLRSTPKTKNFSPVYTFVISWHSDALLTVSRQGRRKVCITHASQLLHNPSIVVHP